MGWFSNDSDDDDTDDVEDICAGCGGTTCSCTDDDPTEEDFDYAASRSGWSE